jgi:glutaminyl-peptide cyclotransferase
MSTRKRSIYLFPFLGFSLLLVSGWALFRFMRPGRHFDGMRAYQDVLIQVSFGARTPGSVAHRQTLEYIQLELEKAGWQTRVQTSEWDGFLIQNLIGSQADSSPRIIIGAHYDSRLLADQDPGPGRSSPVPGANDGASGVAVLLELARTLPANIVPVWLVFIDGEDNGDLDNRQWIMGSRAFVAGLKEKPESVVIVDMIGDADLNIYVERNSDSALTAQIWSQAKKLGFGKYFISTPKYDIIDDHIPFLEAGIPAVDIIDFDYPYWHTTADTVDKVSGQSLQVVGETLLEWIRSYK